MVRENETPEEKTFRLLTRTPFLEVVDHVSQTIFARSSRESRIQMIIRMWARLNNDKTPLPHGRPSSEWHNYYSDNGWTIDELFEEASKQNDKMG